MFDVQIPTPLQNFRQAQPAPVVRSITTIGASNLAKARRCIPERACLAALWILGRLVIEQRTATLAAAVFGISAPSVHRALAELGSMTADGGDMLGHYWGRASAAERAKFVRANLPSIWDQVDSVTR